MLGGFFGVPRQNEWMMLIAKARQLLVTAPGIGSHFGVLGDTVFDKRDQAWGVAARNQSKPEPACVNEFLKGYAVRMFLTLFGGAVFRVFALADLDRANDDGLMVDAPAFATSLATQETFIHFDNMLAADAIAFWPDHPGAEFVEDLKGGFVTGQAKLPLELKGGLAGRLGRHQVTA